MNDTNQNDDSFNLANLTSYREKRNLSVQAVADEIKVSKDMIAHIEAGRFEKLGAPAFLRGHMINYCKAIGLDPQTVLNQIPAEFLRHQNLQLSGAMGSSPLARVKIQSNHFGRYAVGTALLGMLGLSFYFIWDKWTEPVNQPIDPALGLSQELADTNTKKVTYSSLIPQAKPTPPKTDDNPEQTALDSSADAADQMAQQSTEASIEDTADTAESSQEPDAVDDNNLQGSIETEQPESMTTAAYAIQLELSDEAWVSITAADGKKIVHDILGPGLREFQSNQPLHFRMGNANHVKIMINEQAVDFSPNTNNNVADFDWPLNPS